MTTEVYRTYGPGYRRSGALLAPTGKHRAQMTRADGRWAARSPPNPTFTPVHALSEFSRTLRARG